VDDRREDIRNQASIEQKQFRLLGPEPNQALKLVRLLADPKAMTSKRLIALAIRQMLRIDFGTQHRVAGASS